MKLYSPCITSKLRSYIFSPWVSEINPLKNLNDVKNTIDQYITCYHKYKNMTEPYTVSDHYS